MRQFLSNRSIAFRLIVAVLAVEAVSAGLVIALAFGYERHAHFSAFRVMLHGRADSILGAVQDSENADDTLILNKSDMQLPDDDVWEVTDQAGRLLGRSSNWNGPSADSNAKWRDGYLRMALNHRHYVVLALHGTRAVDPGTPTAKTYHLTVYCGAPVEPVWRAIRGAVEFYAAGSLLLLVVTGPLIAWLLHRGLVPLRELASLASQVSVNSWKFEPPESARSTPELAPLTLAIESVLDRLQRSFDQQRTFISDAAHELKTAVAVIKSSLQLLLLRPRSADEYQAGLARCLTDIERMEELVARMLMLARLESAEDAPRGLQATELGPTIQRVVTHLGSFAQVRHVTVDADWEMNHGIQVALDEGECFTLISNLLLNALQHGSEGSSVRIRANASGDRAQVSLSDEGVGIDPAILPHVFERFYRGDSSRSRDTGGAGLGLAICKAIVDRAGGEITLESNPVRGVTAIVLLPLVEATSLADSAAKVRVDAACSGAQRAS